MHAAAHAHARYVCYHDGLDIFFDLLTFAYCLIMFSEQGARAWTFGSAWCPMRRSCVRCRCTLERRRERSARSTIGTTLRRCRASSSAWATRTATRSAGALFRLFFACMHHVNTLTRVCWTLIRDQKVRFFAVVSSHVSYSLTLSLYTYGLRVVGHGIVRTVSPLTGSRRLLEEDESDSHHRLNALQVSIKSFGDSWNHTSKPCSTLVETFVGSSSTSPSMGVVDMDTLERCVHWRRVSSCLFFTS